MVSGAWTIGDWSPTRCVLNDLARHSHAREHARLTDHYQGNQVCRYAMLTRPPGAEQRVVAAILGASGAAKMPFYEPADRAHLPRHRTRERGHRGPSERRCTAEMFRTAQRTALTLSRLAARARATPSSLYPSVSPSSSLRSLPRRGSGGEVFFPPHFSDRVPCARALGPYCTTAIGAGVCMRASRMSIDDH